MTSTLCQSAVLARIIAELFGIIVKTILSLVENAGDIRHEPGVCCRVAGVAQRGMVMLVPLASLTLQDACSAGADPRSQRLP